MISRRKNFALLVSGFIGGQGSVFLVSTYLVSSGDLAGLALFSTHLTFAVLAAYIIDWGSLTILPVYATSSRGETDVEAVWRAYWSVTIWRLAVALIGAISVVVFLYYIDIPSFSRGFVASLILGLLIWASNPAGVLDALALSGLSGLISSLPYMTAAAAAYYVHLQQLDSFAAGAVIGGAFSAGSVFAVAAQFAVLSYLSASLRMKAPPKHMILRSLVDGASCLAQWLPGQIFYRLQILLCGLVLGTNATGLFMYSKQIVNAILQLLVFVRRVNYPNLIVSLQLPGQNSIRTILSILRHSNYLAIAFSSILLGLTFIDKRLIPAAFETVAPAVRLFSLTILSGGLYATLSMGLLAASMYGAAARISIAVTLVGIGLSYLFVHKLDLAGLAAAEILTHGLGVAAVAFILNRKRRAGSE
jgi:hypothetical protein